MAFCVDCEASAAVFCDGCDRPLCDECADDGDGLCLTCSVRPDDDDPEWGDLDLGGEGEL